MEKRCFLPTGQIQRRLFDAFLPVAGWAAQTQVVGSAGSLRPLPRLAAQVQGVLGAGLEQPNLINLSE